MPLIRVPDHRDPRTAQEPATVLALTIIVAVQCACGAQIGLLNVQPAVCESCGALFALDAVTWEKGALTPKIAISASPSRAQALIS